MFSKQDPMLYILLKDYFNILGSMFIFFPALSSIIRLIPL